ncbi:MAG: nucleotidyltransferase domain-containing protein [Lachnospiraceae bacterium]|nr:nucleotidyltransferase domain-containing protein [Lachnospiraceae bacterium]
MNTIEKEIQEKLIEIEEKENIRILLAVESGSRAWGFASPDSDYDVRFIYLRPFEDYLCLNEKKDVIEWQLDEILDINGWDLKKALIQFRRGNATLFEWSNSPIVYRKAPEWDELYQTAQSYFSVKSSLHHYYGTAQNTFLTHLTGDQIKYKKYFYALRPLLACRYIEEFHTVPPVLFDDLLNLPLELELKNAIEELVQIKKITDEKELNPQIPIIRNFIVSELTRQKECADNMADDHNKSWEELNHIFRKMICRDN